MNSIGDDNYQISYEEGTATVVWSGVCRLPSAEFKQISDLLATVAGARITLDLRGLSLLNSAGINVLSRFLLRLRAEGGSSIHILGNQKHTWQSKTLLNLQRLLRGVDLHLEW